MKRFPKILAATCAAVALSSSLALAAEPAKQDAPAPAPVVGPHGAHGGAGMGHMAGPMMGILSQLPPEKQAVALKLMDDSRKALYPMHQSLYAKYAELEALNAAGDGESSKAKGVIRDIADLNAKMLQENGKLRARMFKETGLRVPVMGHGPMGGGPMGGMMGGKGCGMMSGQGGMGGMMGGMMGGAPAAAPGAQTAPAPAGATGHDAHAN